MEGTACTHAQTRLQRVTRVSACKWHGVDCQTTGCDAVACVAWGSNYGSRRFATDRMPRTVDGTFPTQAPNSRAVVMELNRHVLPIEKLLIHGFPARRMDFPAGLSESHFNRLGGNTMHVKCVAATLLLALGSVNWQSSASMAGGHPPVLPGKAEAVAELGSWPTAPRKRCGGGAAGKPNGKYHTVILSA